MFNITDGPREFTTRDWQGYAGAVEKDGHIPVITALKEQDCVVDLTVSHASDDSDECVVQVNLFTDDNSVCYNLDCYNWEVACKVNEFLANDLTTIDAADLDGFLKRKGFQRI